MEAHVELAAQHLREHRAAHAVAQLGLDLRCRLDQFAQEHAQAREFGIEDGADAQRAAHRRLQVARRLLQVAHRGQHALGLRQQRRAVGRERQPVRRAREQPQAGVLGQALELQAHGRLREVQPGGGARDAAFARGQHEGAQDLEVHRGGGSHIRQVYTLGEPNSLAFPSWIGPNDGHGAVAASISP